METIFGSRYEKIWITDNDIKPQIIINVGLLAMHTDKLLTFEKNLSHMKGEMSSSAKLHD